MTKTTNLTYDELFVLAKQRPAGTLFQIRVRYSPISKGKEQVLTALIETEGYIDIKGYISTYNSNQNDIDGVDYTYNIAWKIYYKGTFDFLGFMVNENELKYKKPEVLPTGTKVRINEEARKCGDYEDWEQDYKDMVGKVFEIENYVDDFVGIHYCIGEHVFSHYCVEPVYDELETVKELTMTELEEKLGYKVKIIK